MSAKERDDELREEKFFLPVFTNKKEKVKGFYDSVVGFLENNVANPTESRKRV